MKLGKMLIVAAAAIVGFTTAARAEAVLKLASFPPPHDPTYKDVIKPWIDEVNALGKGVVRIDGFPGGTLGRNPRLQVKLVNDGVADMAWIVPAYSPGRFPGIEVLELPGLFRDVKESSLVARRLYDKGLFEGFDDFFVVLLCTTHPYSIHTTSPVEKISDLHGMKLRAGGPVAGASMRALGVVPVGMPVTQIAENISKGILQGSAAEWNVTYAFRIIDVAKHHFMARLGTVPLGVVMNKKRFDGLPDKAKEILRKTTGETLTKKFGEVHYKIQGERLEKTKKLEGHHVVYPSSDVQKDWDTRMQAVVDEWVKKDPKNKARYDAAVKELAAIRAGG
jgi:TRAP-type C4-dicarboxylate transport system substrate-binding protein